MYGSPIAVLTPLTWCAGSNGAGTKWSTASPTDLYPAMGRALVLNASYEPLGVVASRRAVVLVLADKADMVHDTGRRLHSQRVQIPVPSVIRLRYLVKVPYQRRVNLSRRAVLFRDGRRCQYCGRDADSIDHVVPRSRGGLHVLGQRRGRLPPLQPGQGQPPPRRSA